MNQSKTYRLDQRRIVEASTSAACAIPPAWPLTSSVAVNPFLGQRGENLFQVSTRLARVAGIKVTMPRSWYQAQIAAGRISDADLGDALLAAPAAYRPPDLGALKAFALLPSPAVQALPSVAELAAHASGVDWPAFIADRIGAWAAGYFDEGQALWAAPRGKGAYAAWRAVATHDLTPEIAGVAGFAAHVQEAPGRARDALVRVVHRLDLPAESLDTYFHHLLMTLGGWAQYARYLSWQAELASRSDETLTDLLVIRLIWEEALFDRYAASIAERWAEVKSAHATLLMDSPDCRIDAILQDALERAAQRTLARTLSDPAPDSQVGRPELQAAFCIDVRSEVFRRALEAVNPNIQTLGFAGFFGLSASHRGFASDVAELRLPALLNPVFTTSAGGPAEAGADRAARIRARAVRAWGRFKLAAVSSFAFVEAAGLIYVGKLIVDALGLRVALQAVEPAPRFDTTLDLATRTAAAEKILRAMSFTRTFARLVILAGHGASVVNNPQASGLQCGACGGYSGEVNARLLAGLLNDADVRAGLAARGILIPADTLFVGAVHDTITDAVVMYSADSSSALHEQQLDQARAWLAAAGKATRTERALRLPRVAAQEHIRRRSRDWAEVRPEWALAGCSAFIAAPRRCTLGKCLEGRAFLHDYDWDRDPDFGVLEMIMTAPVVVASWINLQYYGSTVAPQMFGAGNKLLHNVVGGIGVFEGNGGVMRAGVPWQSIHDGEQYAHQPLRLSACIAAPREAMIEVLSRHEGVRALVDNQWVHLFALDDNGRMAWRYAGDLQWSAIPENAGALSPLNARVEVRNTP